jgi:hypothetical protein
MVAISKQVVVVVVIALVVTVSVDGFIGTSVNSFQKPALMPSTKQCSPTAARMSASEDDVSDVLAAEASATRDDDDPIWQAYAEMVHAVKGKVRFNKKKNVETDFLPALDYLISKEVVLEAPDLTTTTPANVFEQVMADQKLSFQQKTNLTEVQHDYAMKVLSYMGDFCAKRQDPTPLTIAWRKLLEGGMVPRENSISTYMYALSLDETTWTLSGQAATFHDLLFDPNEKTIALRIKSLIQTGDAVGAEALLASLPENLTRLRTYLPILHHYCESHDDTMSMTSVLRLYRQMRQAPGVHLDADTYATLIGSIAERGGFRSDATPIAGLESIVQHSCGPELFNELAQEMADDVLELTNSSARVLHNAFVKGFQDTLPAPQAMIDEEEDVIEINHPASPDDIIISRVTVDGTTAVCPRSQAKLQLFQLETSHREHVHSTLLAMAKDQFIEFQQRLVEKMKNKAPSKQKQQQLVDDGFDADYPVRELQKFSTWLQEKQQDEPFTAVVDGANIGYFGHGMVRYSQIQHIVNKLEVMKERPLVIMPHKYLQPKFYASVGKVQTLDVKDLAVIQKLQDEGKLYHVPQKCLDDYYWMLASIVGDDTDQAVCATNNDGRFPGVRPMLITNDQMRDHKLELLEPRLFRRWCSCHIVNFNFPDPYENEWDDRPIELTPADFFSREIQGNPSGSLSTSNEGETNANLAWHFPVSEWGEHERLCIRIQ